MSSHATILGLLQASSALAALVGTRIHADAAPERAEYPFVIYKRAGLKEEYVLDGTNLGAWETFSIEAWASTRSQAVAVSEAVISALHAAGEQAEEGDVDGIDPDLLERCNATTVVLWVPA